MRNHFGNISLPPPGPVPRCRQQKVAGTRSDQRTTAEWWSGPREPAKCGARQSGVRMGARPRVPQPTAAHAAGSWGGGGATHLELVRLSCSDQLRDEEVCVEKVHVLIQEAVQDEQAVGPGRQGGPEGLGRDPLLPPIGSRATVHAQPGLGAQGPAPAPGQRGRKRQPISRTWRNSNPVHSAQLAGLGDPSPPSR